MGSPSSNPSLQPQVLVRSHKPKAAHQRPTQWKLSPAPCYPTPLPSCPASHIFLINKQINK